MVTSVQDTLQAIRESVAKVVVGYDDVVDVLLVSLISGGHVLLEGPPGVGKTTLAKSFASAVGGNFTRIQMTSDMLPADVIGFNLFDREQNTWRLRKGPIFSNIVMVDELNRASPKVQSAFLEAMQEKQVTIDGETFDLEVPFMVIATQVPYPGIGTYSLTDVQLDRFAFKVDLGYPEPEVEGRIIEFINEIESAKVESAIDDVNIMMLEAKSRAIFVHDLIRSYVVDLVGVLRGNRYVRMGPSTRAAIWLIKGARTMALVDGRAYVNPDDVKSLARYVLAHRLELTSQARADGVTAQGLVDEALGKVSVPKGLLKE